MNTEIKTFLKHNYGKEALDTLQILAQSGSSRVYYRFEFQEKSFIVTESSNLEENKTFLYFTNHFSEFISNLPEIHKVSDDLSLYVQTDLGSQSLMDYLSIHKESGMGFYKKSLSQLVKMQVLGDVSLDYSRCFSYPKFSSLLVLRDLFLFKNYFLNISGLEFNQGKLLKDFERFATDFEGINYRYFTYRDFQSRNIMIYKNEPYFIDYQGGMKGPAQYDLVSLLWQAKANLSDEWKDELYNFYIEEFIDITQRDMNGFEFRKGYELCVVERLLQVLGAYGFRGIFEGKKHFLESIEFGLRNLSKITNYTLLENYPELYTVIQKMVEPQFYNQIKKIIDERNT
ncbi:MAG: aminoglycoside phosphotransferase family protein [Moheibacter sp.]